MPGNRTGLVDEVSVITSPCLVGGAEARSIYRAPELASPEGVIGVKMIHLERLGGDLMWLRYEIVS